MDTSRCTKCKKFPIVLPTGVCMCPRCKITTNEVKDWNTFMTPTDIDSLILKLERPISVLKAVATLSDDKGLIALAATTLKSIDSLEISEFFTDKEEAEKCQKMLKKIAAM